MRILPFVKWGVNGCEDVLKFGRVQTIDWFFCSGADRFGVIFSSKRPDIFACDPERAEFRGVPQHYFFLGY